LKLDILDEDDKAISKYFQTSYKFIKNAIEEDPKNCVLVHCAQGKSRSATIVIMFLMREFFWSFEKVINCLLPYKL
jgi:protein-tyrosine phosphatase